MIKKNSLKICSDVDLSSYNTLGVSAVASVFVEITSRDDLLVLADQDFFKNHQPFILGGGSNVLFLDDPSKAIIKMSVKGKDIVDENAQYVKAQIGAGENWHEFVSWAVDHNFGGVENLALIPGTVGAAPIQNIGAYGVELEQVFDSLELFDMQAGTFKTFYKKDCDFGYRDSIFKNELRGQVIVTNVTLRLSKLNHIIHDSYGSLQSYLQEKSIQNPEIKDVYEAVIDIRRSKLPDPKDIGNAGSFFKNPVVSKEIFEDLQSRFEDMPFYEVSENEIKIPAGWLIEKTAWRGKQIGHVGTYQNQALVIVNHGKASGSDIFHFSKQVQKSVKETFGIELVPEVNIVE